MEYYLIRKAYEATQARCHRLHELRPWCSYHPAREVSYIARTSVSLSWTPVSAVLGLNSIAWLRLDGKLF